MWSSGKFLLRRAVSCIPRARTFASTQRSWPSGLSPQFPPHHFNPLITDSTVSSVTRRHFSSKKQQTLNRRNVGIVAHVDAGKTTTTERMLYYSQEIQHLGDVDTGTTTTDFLEQERERGITIQSAAVTFNWKDTAINLIDTPGHVDFSVEVERVLRIMDGVIGIFDGVKGVESQSENVWRKARHYRIPQIAFVNKMDRPGSSIDHVLTQLRLRLKATPLLLHLPITSIRPGKKDKGIGEEGHIFLATGQEDLIKREASNALDEGIPVPAFSGVVDLINREVLVWPEASKKNASSLSMNPAMDNAGDKFLKIPLSPEQHPHVYEIAERLRAQLLEQVAMFDDEFADVYLEMEESIPPETVKIGIRRILMANQHHKAGSAYPLPVLCGTSLRNKGVQPLLDALVEFLPSPLDRPPVSVTAVGPQSKGKAGKTVEVVRKPDDKDPLCAMAFKVVSDPQRGPLVFVRVFSGVLKLRQSIINATLSRMNMLRTNLETSDYQVLDDAAATNIATSDHVKERSTRILRVRADMHEEVEELRAGDIGCIVGFRKTRTGDTLVDSGRRGKNSEPMVILSGIRVPEAVFFCAVEPDSPSKQKQLDEALELLMLDDPSVRIERNPETAQTLLKGMGELHLQIITHRLRTEYGLPDVEIGPMRISYRETLPIETSKDIVLQHELDGVRITLAARPMRKQDVLGDGEGVNQIEWWNTLTDDGVGSQRALSAGAVANLGVGPENQRAVMEGILSGLTGGALYGFPVVDLRIRILHVTPESQNQQIGTQLLTAAAVQCMSKLLHSTECILLEPFVKAEVAMGASYMGDVLSELASKRRGLVLSSGSDLQMDVDDTALDQGPAPLLVEDAIRELDGREKQAVQAGGPRFSSRTVVVASMPLRETIGYSTSLRSMTQGTGEFSLTPNGFNPVPSSLYADLMSKM